MPYLTMINVAPEDWSATIDLRRQVIGRDDGADIRLPSRHCHVSRRHAEIWFDGQATKIRDLESKSGTRINGIWINARRETTFDYGDRLWLGGVELELVDTIPVTILEPLVEWEADDHDTSDLPVISAEKREIVLKLTAAELDVALCFCRGHMDDTDIGRLLHRSPHTVRTQVASIFSKLKLHSRGEVVSFLRRT